MGSSSPPHNLRIGLATVRNRATVEARLDTLDEMLEIAEARCVAVVCFPETYIPGLRGLDFDVPPPDQSRQEAALERIVASAKRHGVAVIVGMEWERSGRATQCGLRRFTRWNDSGYPEQKSDSAERGAVLRSRHGTKALRHRWGADRHNHLPRGVALPGIGTLGS